jgi:hypothetical protein
MNILVILAALPLAVPNGAVKIGCSGYSRALNDYVEHEGKISGGVGEFDGEKVQVLATPSSLILTGAKAEIRINRKTGKWIMMGPHGKRPALEWSRDRTDFCDFSN